MNRIASLWLLVFTTGFTALADISGDFHMISDPRYRIAIHEDLKMSTNVTVAHPKTGVPVALHFANALKLNQTKTVYHSLGLYRMQFNTPGKITFCNFPALFEAKLGADGDALTTVFTIPRVSGLSSFGTCYHEGEIRYKLPFRRD